MRILARGSYWVAFGVVAALALVSGPVVGLDEAPRAAEQGPSLADLSRFAGGPPERCAFASPDQMVCSWQVAGRPLSEKPGQRVAGGTSKLVCEVALSHDAPHRSLCQVHAATTTEDGLPPVSAALANALALQPARVMDRLAHARTIAELSHFVGDVPRRCRTGSGEQACAWLLLPGTHGHDRIAPRGEAVGPVALRCVLPLDGSPRSAESCSVTAASAEPAE